MPKTKSQSFQMDEPIFNDEVGKRVEYEKVEELFSNNNMGTEGRNAIWQHLRRAQDGDNALPLGDGHVGVQAPIPERGGGDMSDNSRRGHWMHVNHHNANYCRIRLLSMSMNVLTLVLVPLMILSLFILLNISIAVLCGWVLQESDNGVKLEILNTINKGHISSEYIHIMNEALYGAISKLPVASISSEVQQLNKIYDTLLKKIERLMSEVSALEKELDFQDT